MAAVVLSALAACGEPRATAPGGRAEAPPGDVVYVLDPAGLGEQSSVIAVDAATGSILRTYPAGRDPAMALSRDGTRLFVASRREVEGVETDRLEIVDVATGSVLQTATLDSRWANTLPAYFPTLEVSRDGRWVHVLQAEVLGPDAAEYSIATVDAQTGRVLPAAAEASGCGAASIHSLEAGPRLDVLCHGAHDARFVRLSDNGAAADSERVTLPKRGEAEVGSPEQDLDLWRLSGGAAAVTARSIFAVAQNGFVSVVDPASRRVRDTVELDLPGDAHVAYDAVEVSPDGNRLYLGVGSTSDGFARLSADEIAVFDTSTWERLETITPRAAVESFAVSPSGTHLYAVDTESASLLVLDAGSGEEIRVVDALGKTPTLVEVAGS